MKFDMEFFEFHAVNYNWLCLYCRTELFFHVNQLTTKVQKVGTKPSIQRQSSANYLGKIPGGQCTC